MAESSKSVCSSPNFDYYDESDELDYPFGLILYYAWSVATIVILLNVLVALFSSACAWPPFCTICVSSSRDDGPSDRLRRWFITRR